MPKLEQIKDDVKRLSKADQEALLDWLTNVLQGEADIAAGRCLVVESDSARKTRLKKFFAEWDATHSVSVGEKPSRKRTYGEE